MLNRETKKQSRTGVLAASLIFTACSGHEPGATGNGLDAIAQKPGLEDDQFTTKPITMISALQIDDSDFRVNGLVVGYQDYMSGETPIVKFLMPEKADYIEVIRCSENAIIRTSTHSLDDVVIGSTSLEEERRIFVSNDFWRAALELTNQCVLVSENNTSREFFDVRATSGSWRYLARSCVSPDRLTDKELTSSRNCSRHVATAKIFNFKNQRIATENAALEKVLKFRDHVDGLGREIYFLTLALNNALAACNDAETERLVRLKRKEAITKIAGIGISLGLELSLPASGFPAVKAGEKTWSQLWSETWNSRDAIAGQGAQITQALQWLFSSPNDYPKTCTKAKEIVSIADTKRSELKNVHMELAQAADEAESISKNRKEFEGGL
jgi:hypothetical protein